VAMLPATTSTIVNPAAKLPRETSIIAPRAAA
jgi:hypothetical protein